MSSFGMAGSFDRSGKTGGVPLAPPIPLHETHPDSPSRQSSLTQVGEPVSEIVRQLTRHTTRASYHHGSPFNPEKDGPLDPYGPNFNGKKWYQAMIAMSDDGQTPLRQSGIAFRNLSVHGESGGDADYQNTVGTLPYAIAGFAKKVLGGKKSQVDILNNFDGILESGEMLVVLGPPGSGCSTLLKTIAGEMDGIYLSEDSQINYRGISAKQMRKNFRGEAIYSAEVDVHFPSLTVGDTLTFAANARAPRNPPADLTQKQFAQHLRDVAMSLLGISHTVNTKVGNDFVRGVSGGERKRVSIAEAMLSHAPLQCWDNSTRGLDSANAIEFCKTLRTSTEVAGSTAVVAIYQAPQSAYDVFDKVVVLYEGECIYYGPTTAAKQFFLDMGFDCPEQQTTPDFLTSLTSPAERQPKAGWESKVPKTPKEFAAAWRASSTYKQLVQNLDEYDKRYPIGEQYLEAFKQSRRAQQSKHMSPSSPYTLSYWGQIKLCLNRGFLRLKADPTLTATQLFGNSAMALIVSSVFYNLQSVTSSFYQRGALLFFAVLLNAFASALEILTLYAQRPIVDKHARYALYHPSAEAIASMLTDLPYKITNAIIFNTTLYFMSNLRREPGAFFFFLLVSFTATLQMSMVFRSIASLSRTLSQALVPAAVLILALVIYTGFTIPTRYMLGWSRWINYLDPLAYAFESLMVNEFSGRDFSCSQFVPAYGNLANQVCSTTGAVAGQQFVSGNDYLASSFQYYPSNKWRNYGILWAFVIFQLAVYIAAAEFISAKKSKGEVLVFPRGGIPKALKASAKNKDEESGSGDRVTQSEKLATATKNEPQGHASIIQRQTAIFQWKDVCYDIKIKGEPRRILDHVDGWVKPGTMTALMGVSGAGKTTLLDCLATRVTMGVVTGEMLVDGAQRDQSFQRKTGYVQQQDLHLQTTTVREALRFSAILRQPAHVPRQEKIDYVEEVLALLEMTEYANAVVGVPGEGLNVEQRKRLTIAVELVAKPELLLFLDEPTSGLDSQTSWSIIELLTKLTKHGQAILCTIHQPSAILFERFDRLLFLAKGGKTIYFGPLGEKSHVLTEYFEKNGGNPCPKGENPAEWMLSVIGAAPGSHTDIDWHKTWLESEERQAVRQELAQMKSELSAKQKPKTDEDPKIAKAQYKEFAAPFTVQMYEVLHRIFQQYWRTPSYIYSKIALCVASALFIGFSFFKAPVSLQGLQNQLFSVFMLFTIFGQLIQQIMPNFVVQRSLYEVRERPAKTYSWKVFILSNVIVELPWNALMAVLIFFCWYYPVGFYRNAELTNSVHERGALFFLLVLTFLLFTSTFATMVIAGIDTAETGGNIANLMFSLCLIFCGVLSAPDALPRFWIFMYRVSPFSYLVGGMLGTGVGDAQIVCADNEYLQFTAPGGQTCGQYMEPYISAAGGYLLDNNASNCNFCTASSTNVFLSSFQIYPNQRWMNFGIMWAFIVFNVFAAIGIYWLARVPKNQKVQETPGSEPDNVQKKVSN